MKVSLYILVILIVQTGYRSKAGEKYFTGMIEYNFYYESDSLNLDSLNTVRPAKSDFRYDAIIRAGLLGKTRKLIIPA